MSVLRDPTLDAKNSVDTIARQRGAKHDESKTNTALKALQSIPPTNPMLTECRQRFAA